MTQKSQKWAIQGKKIGAAFHAKTSKIHVHNHTSIIVHLAELKHFAPTNKSNRQNHRQTPNSWEWAIARCLIDCSLSWFDGLRAPICARYHAWDHAGVRN